MIKCRVEWHGPCLLVTFEDGSDMLLQSDWDQVSFCASCGMPVPENWDGRPTTAPEWPDFDPTTIEECLEEYLVCQE